MAHRGASICLAAILLLVSYARAQQCEQGSDVARFDCYPEGGSGQEKCLSRSCCWRSPVEHANSRTAFREVNVPFCYYPKDYPTYAVQSSERTDFGQRLRLTKEKTFYLPDEILNVTVDLIYETPQRLRVRIYDSANKRYEVPVPVPVVEKKANMTDYAVQVTEKPFAIRVMRVSTGVTM